MTSIITLHKIWQNFDVFIAKIRFLINFNVVNRLIEPSNSIPVLLI